MHLLEVTELAKGLGLYGVGKLGYLPFFLVNTNYNYRFNTTSTFIYISLGWAEPHCFSLPCAFPWN